MKEKIKKMNTIGINTKTTSHIILIGYFTLFQTKVATRKYPDSHEPESGVYFLTAGSCIIQKNGISYANF
ncbi:hypothetical protein PITCH_A840075 [uncultured Desulfobacterium sp.]|uniref:Uncharacterized protein n=1 Tax=uncultured Desulfobacterium sp. TaxID=201089 RepID=A0A445N3B2_9BACT|nr:hypothetical protein PITCH_A840075 [uncultured Desulfobacterium sp.]